MVGLPQYAVETGPLRSNQLERIPVFPASENGNLSVLQQDAEKLCLSAGGIIIMIIP